MKTLQDFLKSKHFQMNLSGFDIPDDKLNPMLKDFQRDVVKLALKRGKCCVWEDTGLGKSFQMMEWCHQITDRHPDSKSLILAPLAVAQQLVREGAKFGYAVNYARSQSQVASGINVTNYDMLHHFDTSAFIAVALDESSAIKAESGQFADQMIEGFNNTPYKSAWSATPNPNNYMELGQQSEFLGVMSRREMLSMYFTHDGGDTSNWILMPWAEKAFWEFVCSWAVYIRKPSDLGYSDDGYNLPGLNTIPVIVDTHIPAEDGALIASIARGWSDRRRVKALSLQDQCNAIANIANSTNEHYLIGVYNNPEAAIIKRLIPDAVEVRGSDSREFKEQAAIDFQDGKIRVLVTKPSIFGFGLNFQHCRNVIMMAHDSYEMPYQFVRRCFRFGQQKEVNFYMVYHHLEQGAIANYKRKEAEALHMQEQMLSHMRSLNLESLKGVKRITSDYDPTVMMHIPDWLQSA